MIRHVPMSRLQIYEPRERTLVAAADGVLALAAAAARPFRRRVARDPPERILLLRLERIGDLLMSLPAIHDVRALAPSAAIDLVVGAWNAPLARAIPGISRVESLDARWLAREAGGQRLPALLVSAAAWRRRRYDLAINFEPDIRSNLLLAASGAAWKAGWYSGGGGPLLDAALDYDPRAHTAANATRLVAEAFGRQAQRPAAPLLQIPDAAQAAARTRLAGVPGAAVVGLHASGGRAIKQWDPAGFGEVARRLVFECDAALLLTGAPADRPLIERVKADLPRERVVDVADGVDLVTLAALLERADLLVTGDTGPMHLASAVGTPVVAIFGPSDPVRYAPAGLRDRVIRIDLPCSPCNRIRLPPARCVGHTPDCLAGVSAAAVFEAAATVLAEIRTRRAASAGHASA